METLWGLEMCNNQSECEKAQSISQIQSNTELKRSSCSELGDQLRSGPRSGELIEINISQRYT